MVIRGKIEWLAEAVIAGKFQRNYGVVQRGSEKKWHVVYGVPWWGADECEWMATVDSRDAAVGFIKLLKEN
jgi:hypothetical protein